MYIKESREIIINAEEVMNVKSFCANLDECVIDYKHGYHKVSADGWVAYAIWITENKESIYVNTKGIPYYHEKTYVKIKARDAWKIDDMLDVYDDD